MLIVVVDGADVNMDKAGGIDKQGGAGDTSGDSRADS